MKKLEQLLLDITRLTYQIETIYPELYAFLNEDPITLPALNHPHIDINTMAEYLESLKSILKHYLETHKTNNQISN